MSELYDLYRRNFPFCVREESVVHSLLTGNHGVPGNRRLRPWKCGMHRRSRILAGAENRHRSRGTHTLRDCGMESAYLGYTYTGLDKLYGTAGYRICCYYMMAKKSL